MIKTCENTECNKEFNATRSKSKYCSRICSAQHAAKLGLNKPGSRALRGLETPELFPKPPEVKPEVKEVKKEKTKVVLDDVPKRSERMSLPTGNMDIQTQFVFTMLNKEIDRFEDSAKEQKHKAEKLLTENEKLREELAQLKTDQRIKEIEDQNAKPGGLQGITDSLKGILDNQYIGPVIGDVIRGFMSGGMRLPAMTGAAGGVGELNETVVEVLQWFSTQNAQVQQNFKLLVDALNAVQDKARVPDLLARLVNVINQGSTIVRSNSSASMGYGS